MLWRLVGPWRKRRDSGCHDISSNTRLPDRDVTRPTRCLMGSHVIWRSLVSVLPKQEYKGTCVEEIPYPRAGLQFSGALLG